MTEKQITTAAHNHVLTNINAWSHDSRWVYYDVRTPPDGSIFDGRRIERVRVDTGKIETVYRSQAGAMCGVVTASPVDSRIVFIHGPERPTPQWNYSASRRRGVVLDPATCQAATLDGRDLSPPFTPGALRGGTHVHVFSGDGEWVSYTYEDLVLADAEHPEAQANQRNVGVSAPIREVVVPNTHPRNHDGAAFSVLVTQTVDNPEPGSDQIERAYQDAWIGVDGYLRADGTRQKRALAFLGDLIDERGNSRTELFVVDIPDDVTRAGERPLEGTALSRPSPPRGTVQRRITHTLDREMGGVFGVRHWPRSSPDGSRIAFLMRDDRGVVQLWLACPTGEPAEQLTHNDFPIESAFTWDPLGDHLCCIADGCVCRIDARTGETVRLTDKRSDEPQPLPQACVFSPDGSRIAYVCPVEIGPKRYNQIFVVGSGIE